MHETGIPEVDTPLAGNFGGPKQIQVSEGGQAGEVLQALVADSRVVSMQPGQG